MKKKLILSILSIVVLVNIAGCGADKSSESKSTNTQNIESTEDKFNSEVEKYGELLSSGKTYEEMTATERTDFSQVEQTLSKFTDEFREKYTADVERIAKTRDEAVEKWKKEDEAKKKEEESKKKSSNEKIFSDITTSTPSPVRNDVTGRWKVITVNSDKDIVKYAKDYYENNFSNENEIHAIVNLQTNRTYKISNLLGNSLDVTVHKYIPGEQNDAKKLFSGDVLDEYTVYLDNGKIERIDY